METLRILFWLKWKLLLRGLTRRPSMAAGVLAFVLLFTPISLGAAFGAGHWFLRLPAPMNEHLLRAVLLAIYAAWLLLPLMGYALNDSYDLTKLLVYPVTARRIFAGAVLGSVIDFPVLLALPTLLAVLVGFFSGAGFLVLAVPAVALFLFHTLSLSQAILIAMAGILRSRRFRDVVVIVIPVLWMIYYVLSQSLMRQMVRVDWSRVVNSPTWEGINLLPPGLAARAVAAASRGEWLLGASALAALAAASAVTLFLAGWLVEKVYAGEEVSIGPRRRAEPAEPARPRPAKAIPSAAGTDAGALDGMPAGLAAGGDAGARAGLARLIQLPPVVEAVADKEIKYFFREPYFKAILANMVYMVIVAFFAFMRGPRHDAPAQFGPAMAWGATGWMLFSQVGLVFNIFGVEAGASAVLFLFPASRRQILMGKNLATFAVLSVANLAILLIVTSLMSAFSVFGPLFCWMELGLLIMVASGNLVSVWLPHRVGVRGGRPSISASQGCGYGLYYMVAMMAVGGLMLPVLAALLLPTFWISPMWFALSIPVAIAYSAGLYVLSLILTEPLLLRREVEMIGRLGEEPS